MKEAAKNAVQVQGAPVKGGKAEEAPKEEVKEEEADVDMGGLFGDEYWNRAVLDTNLRT